MSTDPPVKESSEQFPHGVDGDWSSHKSRIMVPGPSIWTEDEDHDKSVEKIG